MRPLAPVVLVCAVALVACGGGDSGSSGDTLPTASTQAPGPTTTIDPELCFEVPEAATVPTTAPPTTAPVTTAPTGTAGPQLPADTTVPATTTPATTAPPTTPDTSPGTTTPGVEGDFASDGRPQAIRPCELPTALQISVLRPGTGRRAQTGDTVYIDYTGVRSEDGQEFDTSYTRGEPLQVTLGQGGVIPGWEQGLLGVQSGALVRLDIPAELAYGDSPSGDIIQAGDALTFLTEVRIVVAATTTADAPLDIQVQKSVGAEEVTTVDVIEGTGPEVQEGQTAIIHAILVRGDNLVVLTDTWASNAPTQVQLVLDGASLPGLVEGLIGAPVGTQRVITIPADDAYGPEGNSRIGLPAGADLIMVVEVLGVFGDPS